MWKDKGLCAEIMDNVRVSSTNVRREMERKKDDTYNFMGVKLGSSLFVIVFFWYNYGGSSLLSWLSGFLLYSVYLDCILTRIRIPSLLNVLSLPRQMDEQSRMDCILIVVLVLVRVSWDSRRNYLMVSLHEEGFLCRFLNNESALVTILWMIVGLRQLLNTMLALHLRKIACWSVTIALVGFLGIHQEEIRDRDSSFLTHNNRCLSSLLNVLCFALCSSYTSALWRNEKFLCINFVNQQPLIFSLSKVMGEESIRNWEKSLYWWFGAE